MTIKTAPISNPAPYVATKSSLSCPNLRDNGIFPAKKEPTPIARDSKKRVQKDSKFMCQGLKQGGKF
jgi:hypothetical protein